MRFTRLAFLALLVAVTGLVAGCGKSNNEGKIQGKWKIEYAPGFEEQMVKQLASMQTYAYIEFGKDTCTIGVHSENPQVLDGLAKSGEKTTMTCKYKLLSGDGLEMYDLPPELKSMGTGGKADRARTKVKIDGDNMTMTDDDGKQGKLTRVK
jgi:hypothetical protein